MLKAYLLLGLDLDADDQQIRQKYLQMVKTHSPEREPVLFQKITEAYESIKNERSRLYTDFFATLSDPEPEETILTLALAARSIRRRPGLGELIMALEK